ncbi:DUF4179 domain-containing protein [Paenibacillus mucilaginosus]|uniref:DUF4179 domain-containing protein n=1 Tax=Paenibacillus mucilaginosus TaxID=61624 RepID=UPI003D1BD27E
MRDEGISKVDDVLRESGERLQAVSMPAGEALNDSIRRGFAKAKQEQRVRRDRRKGFVWIAASVCMLIMALGITVRVSPVWAAALGELPGLRTLVALVGKSSDQGLQVAVAHEYMQPVGVSGGKDGLSFTVDGILADAGRLVVFYSLRSETGGKMRVSNPQVLDGAGISLQASYSYGDAHSLQEDGGVQRGMIDIHMAQGVLLPDEIRLRMDLVALPEDHAPSWSRSASADGELRTAEVQFGIDTSRFAEQKRELEINRSFEVDGQRITVVKATVTPLRADVLLKYDEANTKQIFSPVGMQLTDNEGRQWREIGLSSLSNDSDLIQFESTYFLKPSALYLEGGIFRALDKEDMTVVMRTDTGELLRAPDSKLTFGGMSREGDYTKLVFRLEGLAEKDLVVGYNILDHRFQDAEGRPYELAAPNETGQGTISGISSDGIQSRFYYLKNATYAQPLTFRVNEYPSYIEEAYRLQIQ